MTTSSLKLDEVRSMLASLQSVELPLHDNVTANGSVDAALLEHYRQARDLYLQRRILHSLFEHVETFSVDETTGKPHFAKPTTTPEGEDENDAQQILSNLQDSVQRIHERQTELRVQFATFNTKRDALEQMVHEVAAATPDEYDDALMHMDDDMEQVDDAALQEQEDKLVALQQRKAALEAQIRHVDKENLQVQKSIKSTHQELELATSISNSSGSNVMMMTDVSPKALAQLQDENAKMQSNVYQLEEIHEFYQHLTQIVEELGGIRILNVEHVPEDEKSSSAHQEELRLTVLVYGTHKIQLGLKSDDTRKRPTIGCTKSSDNLKVVYATFLTSTMLQNSNKTTPGSVHLRIPDLSDFVGIAEKMAPAENVRFVVREAAARIRTLQARVEELSELETVAVTKIYPIQNVTSFGGDDQEVICSLEKEQVSILLRMTPDCPLVNGSVYIAQLVGIGGWDNAVVAGIEERVNALEEYRRPIDVIRAVKKEIQRLQDHEGLRLPPTPTLPARRV